MKAFVLEVTSKSGDMDATLQAFHIERRAPWRPGRSRQP